MNTVKQLQDIHIEPLNISYVGVKNVFSEKNKSDLLKIVNKYHVFDNQSFKHIPSLSTEKAVLLLQVYNKKLNTSHLDDISAIVLAKKVDQLAHRLLLNTDTKPFGNLEELINPLSYAFTLPTTFSVKFIDSFENALLSSTKFNTSALGIALISDSVRSYKTAVKSRDDLSAKFALFQGLYGTLQGILGAESLYFIFLNLIESSIGALDALTYMGALSGMLTVAFLNIFSAFSLYRHHKMMSPITDVLQDKSTSEIEKCDRVAQYLQDQVSVTPEDVENTYKHALEAYQKNKNCSLDPKAEKYLFMADLWFDKNSHRLLDGSEEDPISALELLENPFKISLANELARVYESKINTFEKYMGSKALQHVQSDGLSNQKLVEVILKEDKSFRKLQYTVIVLSLLAGASGAAAAFATGGIAIAASAIFIGILTIAARFYTTNLLSKLKDHILTQKEKMGMALHIASSALILAITVGIGIAMGTAIPILIPALVITILPIFLYLYILWKANHQLEKQANESTHKILSNSL